MSRVKHMESSAKASEKKRHRSEARRGGAFDEEVGVPGAKKARTAGAGGDGGAAAARDRAAAGGGGGGGGGAGLSPFLSERDVEAKSRKLAKHGKPAHHGFKSATRYRRR